MRFFLGIAALLPIWLLGASLVGIAGLRRDDGTDLPLEWAAGVATLGIAGSLLVVAGVPLSPLYVWSLIAVAAAAGWRRGVRPRIRFAAPDHGLSRFLAGGAALVLLLLFVASLQDRLSWDGFTIWALKARMLFDDGALPADYFAQPGPFDFSHAAYPIALPLLDWWMFAHAGAPLPALASVGGAVWFALVVWLFWHATAHASGFERHAALATFGLAVFWPIWYFATGGTADVIMVLAFLGVAIELERAAHHRTAQPLLRALVYLALAALAKNEGLAAALVGALVIAGLALRHLADPARWRVAALAAGPLALAGAWRVWTATHGADVPQVGSARDPGTLMSNALDIGRAFVDLATYRQWPPLLLIVLLGVWRWRRLRLVAQTPVWLLLGGYLVLALGVYLTTEMDLPWLLETSLGRVVSGLMPAALFLTLAGFVRQDVEQVVDTTPSVLNRQASVAAEGGR